jgi:AraC family transcriptional regulator of adaptative response/methylated-DNA-[protein]-cysteine methyltransferase
MESTLSHLSYPAGGDAGELVIGGASYGAGGRGAQISYALADSPCGRILLATTRHGVCWIGLHADDSFLIAGLRSDLPAAEIAGESAQARIALDVILNRYFKLVSLKVSLDILAPPFHGRVWRELCRIPWGATRSYSEIARRLGQPSASRAVGRANGSNPLAVLIPCHRALGADGRLTGYRWGLDYKRRLLAFELSQMAKAAPESSLATPLPLRLES